MFSYATLPCIFYLSLWVLPVFYSSLWLWLGWTIFTSVLNLGSGSTDQQTIDTHEGVFAGYFCYTVLNLPLLYTNTHKKCMGRLGHFKTVLLPALMRFAHANEQKSITCNFWLCSKCNTINIRFTFSITFNLLIRFHFAHFGE